MITKIDCTARDRDLLAAAPTAPRLSPGAIIDYSHVIVRKPWGHEYLIFANDAVAAWILYLKHGAQTSMHCHPNKKTSLVVLEGEVLCSTLLDEVACQPGEGLLLDKGVFHQTTATSEAGALILEIETPLDKRDLVRLWDRYGREGHGYETAEQYSRNLQESKYLSLDDDRSEFGAKTRFGQCALVFRKAANARDLSELLSPNAEDVISVLKGGLADRCNRTIVETGDTMTVREFRAMCEDSAEVGEPVEVLVVRRFDRQDGT